MAYQIRWGVGYSNVVVIPWGLDAIRTWRIPRAGSERSRSDAGVFDAWLTGWDYYLAVSLRWIERRDPTNPPGTGWDGGTGVEAMLAWCAGGNGVRFVADDAAPDNYVDGELFAPWDGEPSLEDFGPQTTELIFRSTSRPYSQALAGMLFEFKAGSNPSDFGGTFTRSTTGTYCGADGLFKTAAVNELRHEWLDLDNDGLVETLGTLIEPARTNLVLQASDHSNATWTKTQCTVTPDITLAPDGTLTADKMLESAAVTVSHRMSQSVTITAAGTYAISVWFKPDTRTRAQIRFSDAGDTNRILVSLNTAAGGSVSTAVLGTGALIAGTSAGFRRYRNGWWRFWVAGTLGGAITAATYALFLLDGTGNTVYTGTTADGGTFWNAQCEAGQFPSSSIPTTTATVTRAVDALSFPMLAPPQNMTTYVKVARPAWADVTAALTTTPVHLVIGLVSVPGASRMEMSSATGSRVFQASLFAIAGQSIAPATSAFPAGTTLEHCVEFSLFPLPKVRQDVGSGYGALSVALTEEVPAWSHPTIGIGTIAPAASNAFGGAFLSVKIAAGAKTRAEMAVL